MPAAVRGTSAWLVLTTFVGDARSSLFQVPSKQSAMLRGPAKWDLGSGGGAGSVAGAAGRGNRARMFDGGGAGGPP